MQDVVEGTFVLKDSKECNATSEEICNGHHHGGGIPDIFTSMEPDVGLPTSRIPLGCGPLTGCQWQMKVYRDSQFPIKNVIILVVTVTGKGDHPRYNL